MQWSLLVLSNLASPHLFDSELGDIIWTDEVEHCQEGRYESLFSGQGYMKDDQPTIGTLLIINGTDKTAGIKLQDLVCIPDNC